MAAKRRPRQTKARAEAETEILEKGRWSQLRANDRLHTPAENKAAQQRCRQLIDGGVAAVDWLDLYGQKRLWSFWGVRLHHPFSDADRMKRLPAIAVVDGLLHSVLRLVR